MNRSGFTLGNSRLVLLLLVSIPVFGFAFLLLYISMFPPGGFIAWFGGDADTATSFAFFGSLSVLAWYRIILLILYDPVVRHNESDDQG